jgi:RNA polymerase sigma-70 factor (ECF subfamily)
MAGDTPDSTYADLNDLPTDWTDVRQAHGFDKTVRQDSQARFFRRYRPAILKYVKSAVRDENAAEEIVSNFFFRFVDGRFANATPDRGRFRDYIKSTLFNLVRDHFRRSQAQPHALPNDLADELSEPAPWNSNESEFLHFWREHLLETAWEALRELEHWTPKPYTLVLADWLSNKRKAREIAKDLSAQSQKSLSEEWVRSVRKEARDAYTDLILAEVWSSIESPSAERVEQELIDLELLPHLRGAIERRKQGRHCRGPAAQTRPKFDSRAWASPPFPGSVIPAPQS